MAQAADAGDTRELRSPAVSVRALVQRYDLGLWRGGAEVLHGIDLDIERGACIGLVGPNGSGKSTLLRVLCAVDEPTHGAVRVFGLAPDDTRARRATGFCPEDAPFPAELSARAFLDALGSLYGMQRAERGKRAAELLERVGLTHAAHKPLGRYSRGMLRRLGVAQALLHRPELVCLDEPTAGLDAIGYDAIENLLREERARGTTLILASHLLSDLHRGCNRLVVLVDGRIAAQGSALELVRASARGAPFDLTVSGLDIELLASLESEIERRGGRVEDVRPAQSNLVRLYRGGAARP